MPQPINAAASTVHNVPAAIQPPALTPAQLTAAINAEELMNEENEILAAVPLALDDTPLDSTELSTPLNVRTRGGRANSVRPAPPSFKNTRVLINWFRRHGSKDNPMPSDEDLKIKLCEELQVLSVDDTHKDMHKGGSAMTKCDCLTVFRDPEIRFVCASWLCYSFKRKKEDEDQELVTWWRYVGLQSNEKNKNQFVIPFNNIDESVDLTPAQMKVLNKSTLCLNGISLVVQRGKEYWARVKRMACSVGVAKSHGNVGKKRSYDNS